MFIFVTLKYNSRRVSEFSGYKPIIGVEIHIELKTKSKMFCQCSADYWGKLPNTQTCPVCLGMPGALPVPNKRAIEWTIMIAYALNCRINKEFYFERKHYFYPDLPKGYQITQRARPIGIGGWVEIFGKKFHIEEVHLEEDTGKLIHNDDLTLIDFNRAGVPLVEIVTKPDFEDSEMVKRFLEEIQTIVRYLGVSDADMEKGSMRIEPNISVAKVGERKLPSYKVEVKNINSFNFAKKAIDYEISRQIEILKKGRKPLQETRGFDEKRGITILQRVKEMAADYRYFPEPDIPPFKFTDNQIKEIVKNVPELPFQKVKKYVYIYGVDEKDAYIITRNKEVAEYFEKIIADNRITNTEERGLVRKLASMVVNKRVSLSLSPQDFVKAAIKKMERKKTDLASLRPVIDRILKENVDVIEKIKKGEKGKINYLIGLVMKEIKGQADPKVIREEIERMI
uniref:Aspartyl/glutamyl-tRNA(Asn/Gln) amidotransferase subunit B n=1 Tax=candidate division CPR3 bacterium TaxID=2268181 RepID=A0A7C5YUF4_UNCC3